MRLASYAAGTTTSYGVLTADGGIIDLPAAAKAQGGMLPTNMIGFIAAGQPALDLAKTLSATAATTHIAGGFALLAPIPRPTKNVFCIGRNYKEHVAEGYRAAGKEIKLPDFPQFFTKPPTAVIGPDAPFYHNPEVTQRLDYEVELALIIGTAGRDIPAERAWDHVFGFTILNDITARDLQRRHDQWFKGKGLDRSCPMGPFVVTRDEIADPGQLELSLSVNGEPRQRAKVAQMIFPIPEIIASLSAGLTLEAGDIIATGTPSGVGFAMKPPGLLKGGDIMTCEISRIGRLTNPVVEV